MRRYDIDREVTILRGEVDEIEICLKEQIEKKLEQWTLEAKQRASADRQGSGFRCAYCGY